MNILSYWKLVTNITKEFGENTQNVKSDYKTSKQKFFLRHCAFLNLSILVVMEFSV